jgi:methionyl-tRNA formyltransferase
MLKITILTDKNSWMVHYSTRLAADLRKNGHSVSIVHDKKEMVGGDIVFLLSCFQLIQKEYLALYTHNIVVHASDLPNGKGWSPMTWQILDGKNVIPLTLFEAVEQMDAGNFYLKDEITLHGSELIDELRDKLGKKIAEMCLLFVGCAEYMKGKEQEGKSTFYRRRTPADSELDINRTINEQFNLLRVADNDRYPAFFIKNGVKYILSIRKSDE